MKKLILLLVCFFSVQTMLWADNDKPIQIGQLPTKAQTLITTYFKGYKVALAKMESGCFIKIMMSFLRMEKNWNSIVRVTGQK